MKSVLFIALFLLLPAGASLACSGCREPGSDVEAATVMAGLAFSWGVILMLGFVFSLFGGLWAYAWKIIREADEANRLH